MTLNDYINELRIRLEKTQGFIPDRSVAVGRFNNKVKETAKKIKKPITK